MPRMNNPNLEPIPNFNDAIYENVINIIVQAQPGTIRDQAVAQLEGAYQVGRQARIDEWNLQVQQDLEADNLRNQAQQEEEGRRREEEERRQAEEGPNEPAPREQDKKKPKINDFDVELSSADVIIPRPSAYALNKLRNFDWVELYYFTPEGCDAALEERAGERSTSNDAFSLSEIDGLVALKPLAACKASKSVVNDKDLTWRQMTMGKNSMIHYMNKLGWPEKHIDALASFYFQLEDHDMRLSPHGDKILLIFQAAVRREWHDAMERNKGFNISIINPVTLRMTTEKFHDKRRAEAMAEVSFYPCKYHISVAHKFSSIYSHMPHIHDFLIHQYASCHMPHAYASCR